MQNNELKLIPCGISKQLVCQWYPNETEKFLRELCQGIQIKNNPHLSEEKASRRHNLNRNETILIIEVMGVPSGYQNKFK